VAGNRPTLQNNGTFLRVNGLDAQSCLERHSISSNDTIPTNFEIGGVGGASANVLFMPDRINPEGSLSNFDGRFVNPPFLFGSGGVEQLAKEMTEDLQSLRDKLLNDPDMKSIKIITHGVNFVKLSSKKHQFYMAKNVVEENSIEDVVIEEINIADVDDAVMIQEPKKYEEEIVDNTDPVDEVVSDKVVYEEIDSEEVKKVVSYIIDEDVYKHLIPSEEEDDINYKYEVLNDEVYTIGTNSTGEVVTDSKTKKICSTPYKICWEDDEEIEVVYEPGYSDVNGVDKDLVVKPFGRKGEFVTVRDFAIGAEMFHFGMQPVEIVGDDVDVDEDGVSNELLRGEMSTVHVFGVSLQKPIMEPQTPETEQGAFIFNNIGCSVCHIPAINSNSRYLELIIPKSVDPDGVVYTKIDLVEVAGFEKSPITDGVIVTLFADLKRHHMGYDLKENFDNTKINSQFTTARLCGRRDTAPYLHDGRALTITDAILYNGGEALDPEKKFMRLSETERNSLIAFLYTLRTSTKEEQVGTIEKEIAQFKVELEQEPVEVEFLEQVTIELEQVEIEAIEHEVQIEVAPEEGMEPIDPEEVAPEELIKAI
jgi:hypothetical protein